MKCVEQFTEINKLCNVASFWLYFGTTLHNLEITGVSQRNLLFVMCAGPIKF